MFWTLNQINETGPIGIVPCREKYPGSVAAGYVTVLTYNLVLVSSVFT